MQSVTSNAVAVRLSNSLDYFETEHLTGEYWIDGKAIYKKTISCGALPNNDLKYTNHHILNIDKIVKLEGVSINTDNNVFPLPFSSYLSATYNVQLSADRTQIALRTSTDRSNYTKTYVTLYYTKV